MSVEYKNSDPVLSGLDIDNELSCPICTNTYYNPITLLCQHTFCHHCVSDDKIKNCPICRVNKFVPKEANDKVTDNLLNDVLKLYYGTEQMNQIRNEVEDYLEDKKMRPKVEKDMEKQLLDNLNSMANINSTSTALPLPSYQNNNINFVGFSSQPLPSPSPYKKYIKWLMYGIIWLLLMGIGWMIGTFIIQLFEVFKGNVSFGKLIYTLVRICGACNITYQIIESISYIY